MSLKARGSSNYESPCIMLRWNVQQWRRRYFVLYAPPASATITSECLAIFDYFDNDRQSRKKGSIDLTQCEEVLHNMTTPHYQHVFCLRTKHHGRDRMYYLAADTENEMNKWVETLCRVLHLNSGCEFACNCCLSN